MGIVNNQNIADILSILAKNTEIFEQLQADFTDALADLVSFKNNPNCSCKNRLVKYFSDVLAHDPSALDKYVKDPESILAELRSLQAVRYNNNYAGRIITIPNNETAWKNLSIDINSGKFFRSFSVVDKGEELVVYFL